MAQFNNLGPRSVVAGGFLPKKYRGFGLRVINKTGSNITTDKLVAVSGYDTTAELPKIVLADADVSGHRDIWVTDRTILNNGTGFVFKGAQSAANLDTNAASAAGDPVYLNTTAGGFTVTAPTGSNARQQIVGYVIVKSATVGQVHWDIQEPNRFSADDLNGIGFSSGGAVTQITSAATAVTLNQKAGQITTVALTTAAAAEEQFTVNNTFVAATDVIALSTTYAGAGTPMLSVSKVGAGVFDIIITNVHAANALNAVMVINFVVIKSAAA